VTWATGGRLAVRRLLRRTFHWRVNIGWWLTILLALPTLTVGLALLMGDNLRSVDMTSLLFSQLTLLLINFVATNLWEETAWTGLLQTRLEERHNWFVAAMLTAIPFAAIHLPLQFFLGERVTPTSLAIAFGAYLLLCMLFRPLLAVVRRGTGDSLFLVALQHSVFNRTANENGISAMLLTGDARQISLLISVVVITVVTAVLIRSRLSRGYGAELARQSMT
jgi:membrane protease YdiL (CAAX protease family)